MKLILTTPNSTHAYKLVDRTFSMTATHGQLVIGGVIAVNMRLAQRVELEAA